jgi:glycosyltransferase involved in cell wall biosynthesis
MKLITVVTPCFNEEQNVSAVYARVRQAFSAVPGYTYEHLFIDNASEDRTPGILRELAQEDSRVKVILNARNFGQLRSPFHAIREAGGDAVVFLVADLQDPPELIPRFIELWERGARVVMAVKTRSAESRLLYVLRGCYYRWLRRVSDVALVDQFTGFGLYDRKVVDILRTVDDQPPYFRGIVAELGYDIATVEFTQPKRERGKSKNNFFSLFDLAIVGMTSYTKAPLRLATILGFCTAILSLAVALVYFVYKLLFWERFQVGAAPLVIGLFFCASVQLFFLGVIGEYVGAIYTQVRKRPLVVEKERINFDGGPEGRRD